MQREEFSALAKQGFNRIPLVKEVLADLETPLSLYVKLTQAFGKKNTYLLESVLGGERFGRFSFIGLPAKTVLRTVGTPIEPLTEVLTDGKVVETNRDNPLDFVDAYFKRFKVALQPGLPRFCGGLAGYFGYDTVRYIESRLARHSLPDELGVPDIQLMLTEELAVVDNVAGRIYFIVYADPSLPDGYERAHARLKELLACLSKPVSMPTSRASKKTELIRRFKTEDFENAVRKTKEYILAGDCMQVVIGQRISKPFTDSPLSLYRALRSLNPSPYMYYYDFGDLQVVGSSPEILVRQEKRGSAKMVTIRPLAGTRPRGATPEEDERLATELLADPKEIAEHVMLIDLARNDVGRIAKTGSVKVTDSMSIEKYSHVQHIVSSVEGELLDNMSNMDVLRATFPAGTLSGAPKIRAMEIIDEMEIVKRGVYGGAVGYLSYSGDMDVAIAIRTGVIHDGMLHSQAGAGVVADSDPTAEWKETEAKARAVLMAADLVQGGLDAPND
ncbi:anthranilate synthase component 1 [Polynucleobacter sphagniphilus]|jgi:anthranilate synthase component 1|uniref:anthranilate synthase component I n=1 Tax=Polynucleobacter sphagniphilus TaxID=1743169 RepID=UPI00240691A4|nr:anthranilate synthase component I [Polynucleobacter sphagniphilus]MDF9787737.1 anthranilate synthase component 1 [Polynucleobacter sphagniphilus]MDH6242059.1 anthranilate synthase component 1 [Polynucleobacter sphagniphilus]MDH6248555.1 anthranilate synthase component 1 [Polynucleobacter sphagniphilus]MDH6299022.1 anthranilate synthase component 1 [Polynucleobacter sphagniphilus]MDH6421089.1 anthranilate synthase component 1 [Polynucleobacter sphagniphilus]